MSENKDELNKIPLESTAGVQENEQYSLNDDRRVKTLSPGALVAKRFFRNRLAVVGMVMLLVMFAFSFIGGFITPYGEAEQFYTYEFQNKEYAGVVRNNDVRYMIADGQDVSALLQAQMMLAINQKADTFAYKDVTYTLNTEGTDL